MEQSAYKFPITKEMLILRKDIQSIKDDHTQNVFMQVNKFVYQSALVYGMLDKEPLNKEDNELVRSKYFEYFDQVFVTDLEYREDFLNELGRRLDHFYKRMETEYSGAEGKKKLKRISKIIHKYPDSYLFYLTEEEVGDVKCFDSITSMTRAFKFYDDLYCSDKDSQMKPLSPFMDKYLENPIYKYFSELTTDINLNSRGTQTRLKKDVNVYSADEENTPEM